MTITALAADSIAHQLEDPACHIQDCGNSADWMGVCIRCDDHHFECNTHYREAIHNHQPLEHHRCGLIGPMRLICLWYPIGRSA